MKTIFILITLISLSFSRTDYLKIELLKENDQLTPFDRYASFFLNENISNQQILLKKIIKSSNKKLGYYESILKILYFHYKKPNKEKVSYYKKVLFPNYTLKLKNTYEGLFLNIFSDKPLVSKEFCLFLDNKEEKNSCYNMIKEKR